jgi:hypothetical protein
VHFILRVIKPVFSDRLSYVTLFQCSLGRPHKTGFTAHFFFSPPPIIDLYMIYVMYNACMVINPTYTGTLEPQIGIYIDHNSNNCEDKSLN